MATSLSSSENQQPQFRHPNAQTIKTAYPLFTASFHFTSFRVPSTTSAKTGAASSVGASRSRSSSTRFHTSASGADARAAKRHRRRLPPRRKNAPPNGTQIPAHKRTASHTGFHRLSGQFRHLCGYEMLSLKHHASFRQPAAHPAGHAACIGCHAISHTTVRKTLNHCTDYGRARRRKIRSRRFPGFSRLPTDRSRRHAIHAPAPRGRDAPAGTRRRPKPASTAFSTARHPPGIRVIRRIAQMIVQPPLLQHLLPASGLQRRAPRHTVHLGRPPSDGPAGAAGEKRSSFFPYPSGFHPLPSHPGQPTPTARCITRGQEHPANGNSSGTVTPQAANSKRLGQIHPETFGRVILLPGLFRLTPQPETAPRSHAPGRPAR